MNKAYLILGSNIRPEVNIPKALAYLRDSFNLQLISLTWRTKSIGAEADDFYNTAVEIETELDAYLLKEKCLCHIEEIMGRIRMTDKNAPRTIDIDIVVFNGRVIDHDIFTMEHLALPLAELAPDILNNKTGLTLRETSQQMQKYGVATVVGKILPI